MPAWRLAFCYMRWQGGGSEDVGTSKLSGHFREENSVAIRESRDQIGKILPERIRWLAIASGCIAAIAGALGFGLFFPILPTFLIVGAIIQPHFPRQGRGLMWVGALFLSVFVLPPGAAILLDSVRGLPYHDVNFVGMTLLWSASFLLLGWCDAELVIEARKTLRSRKP